MDYLYQTQQYFELKSLNRHDAIQGTCSPKMVVEASIICRGNAKVKSALRNMPCI